MAWRRFIIRDKLGGGNVYDDEDNGCIRFQQEYPYTWQEAFTAVSNRTVFNKNIIAVHVNWSEKLSKAVVKKQDGTEYPAIQRCSMKWAQGYKPLYNQHGHVVNKNKLRVDVNLDPQGDFYIYQTPEKVCEYNYQYIVGADVAEGLEQGDYNTLAVYNRLKMQFSCIYRGHCTPLQLAEYIAMLCTYYHAAQSMGEYNKDGSSVVPHLLTFYDNVMIRPELGGGGEEITEGDYWWRTMPNNKAYCIGLVENLMNTKPQAFPFKQFWIETQTFTKDAQGRMNAEGKRLDPGVKNFDDLIIAHAMALVGDQYANAMYKAPPVMPERLTDYQKQQWQRKYAQSKSGVLSAIPDAITDKAMVI
jgi:multimeric flavodoxin WrbA